MPVTLSAKKLSVPLKIGLVTVWPVVTEAMYLLRTLLARSKCSLGDDSDRCRRDIAARD